MNNSKLKMENEQLSIINSSLSIKKVPELRFKGFEGEWIPNVLGDVFITRNDIHDAEDIPLYSLTIENGVVPKPDRYIREHLVKSDTDSYKRIYNGDFVYNPMNLRFGALKVFKEDSPVRVSKYYDTFFTNGNTTFWEYYLTTDKTIRYYDRMSTGSLVEKKRVHYSDFSKFEFPAPTLPEQQKIASFLSDIDSKIEKLTRKKELNDQFKKGMMQKLFSQEIRFKDENEKDFPEWEEKRLGNLFSFKTTNSFSRDQLNYESGSVKNIHYGDIHTKFSSHFDISKERVPFINEDIQLGKISSEAYLQVGDLIIADASEDYADIGKSIEIINLNDETTLAGLHTILARRITNELSIGYIGHFVKSFGYRQSVMKIAQGSKVLSLSSKRMAEIEFLLPSLPEQQKIATFLTDLDTKITAIDRELSLLKEFKRGLLQKMFV